MDMEYYEKIGKSYKLLSMVINGKRYYFIGDINIGGFRWVYTSIVEATEMFKALEKKNK